MIACSTNILYNMSDLHYYIKNNITNIKSKLFVNPMPSNSMSNDVSLISNDREKVTLENKYIYMKMNDEMLSIHNQLCDRYDAIIDDPVTFDVYVPDYNNDNNDVHIGTIYYSKIIPNDIPTNSKIIKLKDL